MIKNLILLTALCLIPFGGLTNAQTDIIMKKRPFSRIVVVNGIRIKITRPLLRKKYRIHPTEAIKIPLEIKPYLYKRSHEGFHRDIKPLYYDSLDSERLRNLA